MGQFKGEVCWFNNAKGYGFVKSPQTNDVFCHFSAIQGDGYKTLKEGMAIEFDLETGTTGRQQAANVTPLNPHTSTQDTGRDEQR